MERRARFRIGVFVAVILVIVSIFIIRLYKLQTVQDEATLQEANSIPYVTTVDAARGQILDRNGTVLVTNRASYNLVVINFVFFNGPSPTSDLLKLLSLCRDKDIEIIHNFPVSEEKPYAYTLDDYSAAQQDYFRRFLRSRGWDPDMSAGTLIRNLREDYRVPDGLSDEEVYEFIAVRYELELRTIDNMPLDNYTLTTDVSAENLAEIIELGVPGVIVETTTVREYKTQYAAHLLGHMGFMTAEDYQNIYKAQGYPMDAVVGQAGVELAFEEYLHGVDGRLRTVVSSTGEVLEQEYLQTPVPGGNVELSIDIGLQAVAEEALEKKILDLRENGVGRNKEGKDAEGGAAVAIEVKTGEILACASYPTYDLSTFREDFNILAADEYKPLFNRALAAYPPGSIYKMVTAIAAMDYGGVGRYYTVTDKGKYDKYKEFGYVPACYIYTSTGGTHGTVNMMEAISVSCNYYFYEVGLMVATKDVDYVAQKLGLGEPTGAELPESTGRRANEETKAQVFVGTSESEWVDGDKLQASIGQSLNQFTPLQMACYAAALANSGTRYSATFLRRVVSWDYQSLIMQHEPAVASQLEISDEAIACIKEGMTMASTTGTANTFFYDYPIAVAAKTGTAQHGSGGSDNASFICYAPADDPEIAIAIYVEKGAQGGNLGEIARSILDAYFAQESKYELTTEENIVH